MKGTGKTFSCPWSLIYRLFVPLGGTLCMCGYFITVAHNCHGKLKFTAANSNSPRQIKIPPHTTSVQYCGGFQYIGGCSVHRGITSVLWGIASILWRLLSIVGDSFSTVGDNISTCRDNISTVEIHQYYGGYSVLWRVPSVLWGKYQQYMWGKA